MPSIPSTTRMEALSDGVIAVILTIMVLEFKVPKTEGMIGFVTILPTFAVYLLSFSFTGIYWVNHHHLIGRLKRVDSLILWCNLAFLFGLSLLPFFTAYLIEKKLNSFSVALYAASLFSTGVGFTLLSFAIMWHLRQANEVQAADEVRRQKAERQKSGVSLALYLVAVYLAFWRPVIALALIAFVTLIWVVPTFGVRHLTHATEEHSG